MVAPRATDGDQATCTETKLEDAAWWRGTLRRHGNLHTIVLQTGVAALCKQHLLDSCLLCLLFYILATSEGKSGRVPTCDSVYSWWPYLYQFLDDAPLGNQTIEHLFNVPHGHVSPDAKLTSACLILLMSSTRLLPL